MISLLTCLDRILEALGWVRMHEAVEMLQGKQRRMNNGMNNGMVV